MKVRINKVSELTPAQYQKCLSLNMRNKGRMRGKLQYCRHRHHRSLFRVADAIMIFDNNDDLLAWALVYKSIYSNHDSLPNVYFYVRHQNRRQGLGTMLDRLAYQRYGPINVFPWNNTSRAFFDAVEQKPATIVRT